MGRTLFSRERSARLVGLLLAVKVAHETKQCPLIFTLATICKGTVSFLHPPVCGQSRFENKSDYRCYALSALASLILEARSSILYYFKHRHAKLALDTTA